MDEKLTQAQAAELLGVSRSRISQLLSAGALEGGFEGGRRFVSKASVEAFMSSRKGRGRPRQEPQARFMLMNASHEVMLIAYHPQSDFPLVGEAVVDALRCPWGTVTTEGNAKRRELNEWWRTRSIPSVRPGIDSKLAELQESSAYALPFRSLGLSLSDSYWLRPMDNEGLSWEKVNFFQNDFETSHREGWDFWLENVGLDSPDNTSEGALPKRWAIRDGARVLLKGCRTDDQRPINEVVATSLHDRLLTPDEYVRYELLGTADGAACCCEDFLSVGEEYIPASSLMSTMASVRGSSLYDRYCRFVGMLGVDEKDYRRRMAQMIACDAILANSDRHRRNFGLIRNVDTLELRAAPLFDSGNSLWYAKTQSEVERRDWSFAVKPFGPVLEQQLALIEETDWFDPGALSDFADEACGLLAQSAHATQPHRLDYIRDGIDCQISLVSTALSVLKYR